MESNQSREPWNKGKLIGQKPPLKPKDIWAIRINFRRTDGANQRRHSIIAAWMPGKPLRYWVV